MAGEIPPRFTDLPVSKLSEGPPARYQLLTKKKSLDGQDEVDSRLRRWTVGERDPTKPNKTILLVGETGAGKSTMINAMVNYVMGVEWEDKVWYEIVQQNKKHPAKRLTSEINVYEIFGFEDRKVPYSLTIIHTSGHAVTKNPGERDKQNDVAGQLHDLFMCETEIQEIDLVGIVMTEGTKTFNEQLRFIYNSVVSLFSKNIQKNIVALITHSTGMSAQNALQVLDDAAMKCAKDENNEPVHFMFQNVQHTVISAKNQSKLLFYWDLTKEGLEGFFGFLVKADAVRPRIGVVQNSPVAGEIPPRFYGLPVSKLSDGPPSRYQLLSKKESLDGQDEADSRLRRWTVGERDYSKPHKVILLVGETEGGKSTLINAMVNHVMGVEWEEMIWFEIVEEEENQQTTSQTADVTVHEIFGFEEVTVPYSLTIIDTPGYGTTDRIDRDILISQTLCDLFRCDKGIKEIDTVGLVLKASDNRLSDRLTYILDAVVSLFGKDLENNIVALLTHSEGKSIPNALLALKDAEVKCAMTKNNETVYFLFNDFQKDNITTKQYLNLSQGAWKMTGKGMHALFKFLRKASSRELNTTLDVITERIRLKACIGNLHDRIELIEMKQTEIRQTRDALEKQKTIMETKQRFMDETVEKWKSLRESKESEQENQESIAEAIKKHQQIIEKQGMERNQTFIVEVDEAYKERVPLGGLRDNKAVCCTVCEETCHYPGCTLAVGPKWCEVMKFGECTSCSGRCSHKQHAKERWRFVNRTRKAKQTLKDLKEKYEKNEESNQETENPSENTIQQIEEHGSIKQETTEEEQELSTQITQLETECEVCMNELRENESIMEVMTVEMKGLEADKARWVEEAYQHVAKLQEISLNTSSMSTYIYLDFLIEKMKGTGDMEKVQRLEDIQKRCEEGRKEGILYIMSDRFESLVEKCKALPSLPAHLKSKSKRRNKK